jgi:hypothetical protein
MSALSVVVLSRSRAEVLGITSKVLQIPSREVSFIISLSVVVWCWIGSGRLRYHHKNPRVTIEMPLLEYSSRTAKGTLHVLISSFPLHGETRVVLGDDIKTPWSSVIRINRGFQRGSQQVLPNHSQRSTFNNGAPTTLASSFSASISASTKGIPSLSRSSWQSCSISPGKNTRSTPAIFSDPTTR